MKANRIFSTMLGLMVLATFTACSSDEADFQQNAPMKSNIISLTSSLTQTRTASDPQATALSSDNKVGVFVTSTATGYTGYSNIKHTVDTDGTLTNTGTAMTYPTASDAKVNIYAYAPYNSDWSTAGEKSFSVSTDQSANDGYLASDLLFASKADQKASATAVGLTFAHKLSLLNITINNTATTDLSDAEVWITGTKIATTFNTETGAVGTASGDATDIKAISALGTSATACAVVVPQTIAGGTALVKIVAGSKTLLAKLGTAGATFESGKQYDLTVNIGATEVTLTLGSSITGWNTTTLDAINMEEPSVTSPLYATLGVFIGGGPEAKWDATTNTYSWWNSINNLMKVFEFEAGTLANYKTMHLNVSDPGKDSGIKVRLQLVYSDNTTKDKTFESYGEKTLDMTASDFLGETTKTLADITQICFGGSTMVGDVSADSPHTTVVTDFYLTTE